MELTENARLVLEKRYLKQGETPEQLVSRVSKAVASVEKRDRARWADCFSELIRSLRFLPNSPTLMNAGKPGGQLAACYVLPVEDSLEDIFEALKNSAKIHQSGGGTGFSFSHLRPKGSPVRSTEGVASGPVSFIRIFDVATETIKQGGARRGANMAVLRVDHPDIVEFIDAKRDHRSILNFNLSVGVTDEFMKKVAENGAFSLRDPRSGEVRESIQARALFDRITQAAWECGDPGMIFLDRINEFNPTPQVGGIESTNPCGEQPLLPYESCNLGSLNLSAYFVNGDVDWKLLASDIKIAVRFLDNVVDLNEYPVPQSRKITLRNRKVGLGVMGFADLLLKLGIPYDSDQGIELGERVMSFIDREAKAASAALAKKKGAFPNWKGSRWSKLGYPKMRNATVTTVAPTGTISIIAGVSSGIEPIFSGVFYRNILSGERLLEVHPAVRDALEKIGQDVKGITEERIQKALGPAWRPAPEVPVEAHIRMQAAFQRHTDSAVSKTINLPKSSRVEDIAHAYQLAFQMGCKGITVYRDGSRPTQVLEAPKGEWPVGPVGGQVCPSC